MRGQLLVCFLWAFGIFYSIPPALRADDGLPGIPIHDSLTIAKCGGCHAPDATGRMRRLSYMRTTPEVWEQNIKRMMRLHGLSATPAEVGQIVRYLSANNGLAPEEAKPIFWEAEHRRFRDQEDEDITPAALRTTCNTCHTVGRVLSQRRTRDDYEKLANLHMALFRYTEISVFRPYTPSVSLLPVGKTNLGSYSTILSYPEAPQAAAKAPLDIALDYLSSKQPLITPEWTAWQAIRQAPSPIGNWWVSGYQKGRGKIYGQMTVEQGAAADEFVTKMELRYANSGRTVSRSGKAIVYAGYSWRGRSKTASTDADPSLVPAESKEAVFIERDGRSMEGRWFWGGYDEFGIDVKMIRAGKDPVVLGTDLYSVKSPSTREVHVFGGGFSPAWKPQDIDLGPGVEVTKIAKSTPAELTLEVTVAPNLPVSMHDVTIHGVSAVKAFAVYDKIGLIKIMPDANFARLGGTIVAKQYAQFEAVAFAAGSGSEDGVALGPVSANWSLEEFFSTPDDDDVNYVGTINDSGLFTPALEGPNPKRRKQANNLPVDNYGDVWVTASFQPETGGPMRAQSYLVVGVPLYIHYDQPEVSQ